MLGHNYIYDPESPAKFGLTPGNTYQGVPPADIDTVDLDTGNGNVVRIKLGDLIARRQKPVEKLKSAASDTAYEMRMLPLAYISSRQSAFAYTSWFIHARNLMDFFEGKGRKKDDVCAQDYFLGAERDWHNARRSVPAPPTYRKYRQAANKLAAHLTYDRAKYRRDSPKPDRRVTEYLGQLAVLFMSRLTPDRRRWFLSRLLPR